VLWSLLHAVLHTANMVQWQPLTLQGAGLFHIAMGAVLGIAAFGRTQEKLGGANNGGAQIPATGSSSGFTAPSAPSAGFGATQSTSFTPASSSFGGGSVGSTSPFGATSVLAVETGFGGKPAPVQPQQPML